MPQGNTAMLMPGEDDTQPGEESSSEVGTAADPPVQANDEDCKTD